MANEAVAIPFWSKKEGAIARECKRCGHRGWFEIFDDPIMVSSEVMCPACGSITFELLAVNPSLDEADIEDLASAAQQEQP